MALTSSQPPPSGAAQRLSITCCVSPKGLAFLAADRACERALYESYEGVS
jgi:hypothetical protein